MPMPTDPPSSSGPMLALLARGLELWLRQQCQTIGSLQIQLEGSAGRLLQGQLEGVSLSARAATYQDMELEAVELRSGPIRVRTGPLWRRQAVELDQTFRIEGKVVFSSDGLQRSLATPRWQDLADGLAHGLGIQVPVSAIRLEGDRLQVLGSRPAGAGKDSEVLEEVRLEAAEGTVDFVSLDGQHRHRLPMDPAIRIKQARLCEGQLALLADADVLP